MKMKKIIGTRPKAEIDRAIAFPFPCRAMLADGRELAIIDWNPCVPMEGIVSVNLTANIEVPTITAEQLAEVADPEK